MKLAPETSLKFLQWTVTRLGVAFIALLGVLTQTSGNAAMENFILILIRFLFLLGAISLATASAIFVASIRDQIVAWIRNGKSKTEGFFWGIAVFAVAAVVFAGLLVPILWAFNFASKDMQTENKYEIRATVDELFKKLNPEASRQND